MTDVLTFYCGEYGHIWWRPVRPDGSPVLTLEQRHVKLRFFRPDAYYSNGEEAYATIHERAPGLYLLEFTVYDGEELLNVTYRVEWTDDPEQIPPQFYYFVANHLRKPVEQQTQTPPLQTYDHAGNESLPWSQLSIRAARRLIREEIDSALASFSITLRSEATADLTSFLRPWLQQGGTVEDHIRHLRRLLRESFNIQMPYEEETAPVPPENLRRNVLG